MARSARSPRQRCREATRAPPLISLERKPGLELAVAALMRSTLVTALAIALTSNGCECSRTPISFEAQKVCLLPDSGRPELGEAFVVRASPGAELDAGCATSLAGRRLVVTVIGVDVTYFIGDEAAPPDVTCSVAPLAAGTYFVNEMRGSGFIFDVPAGDAGFPECAN